MLVHHSSIMVRAVVQIQPAEKLFVNNAIEAVDRVIFGE